MFKYLSIFSLCAISSLHANEEPLIHYLYEKCVVLSNFINNPYQEPAGFEYFYYVGQLNAYQDVKRFIEEE